MGPEESPLQQIADSEYQEFEHVVALFKHLRLHWLLRYFPVRVVHAIYVAVNGFITIGVLGLLALFTHNPFVFPSVGPTAYLFFFTPMAKAASPRHAILGHGVGLLCGYGALLLTGTENLPFYAHPDIYWPRLFAAALSLSATGALMILFRISHPPAGATTLIVSLGIIWRPQDMVIIEAAVVLLTAQAFVINRLAGLPYPVWSPRKITTAPVD